MSSSQFSIYSALKPTNIFYVWYTETCRRQNTNTLSIIKPAKPKNDTVLDFLADRIKAEEWVPILSALGQDLSLHVIAVRSRLQCKFLHDVDTETKIKQMARRCGSLWTAYVLKSLVKSLSICIKRSPVLSYLELDGLPITGVYFDNVLQAVSKNKTIKVLSFKHCSIKDGGCQQLCASLRNLPNVEVLDLTACSLGPLSAQFIASVIKYQQISRYCQSWHCSLRYEDPDVNLMAGLKRITLNNNPNIGDEGLKYILDELDDDLWIRALDMQKCNITENISSRLLQVIESSRSLEIADFRQNSGLTNNTMDKIFQILKEKVQYDDVFEYQWCNTTSTLPYISFNDNYSSSSYVSANVQKSRSAPIKQVDSPPPYGVLRTTKTVATLHKKSNNNVQQPMKKEMDQIKKDILKLNARLQEEMSKREKMEKINSELQKKIERTKTNNQKNGQKDKLGDLISLIQNLGLKGDEPFFPKMKNILNGMNTNSSQIKPLNNEQSTSVNVVSATKPRNVKTSYVNKQNPVRFVFPQPENKNRVQNIFEKLLFKDGMHDEESDIEEDVDVIYNCEDNFNKKHKVSLKKNEDDNITLMSTSNVSLQKFMDEMKSEDQTDSPSSLDTDSPATPVPKDVTARRDLQTHFRKLMLKVK